MFDDCSHRIELVLMFVTFFLAFTTEAYKLHWLTLSVIALVCLVVDFTFFQEDTFIYDPDYNHWKDLNEEKDFQIKQE